jgi:hypothetical protein
MVDANLSNVKFYKKAGFILSNGTGKNIQSTLKSTNEKRVYKKKERLAMRVALDQLVFLL